MIVTPSDKSKAVHSIVFIDIASKTIYNTYDDWGLVPLERPIINKIATSPYNVAHRQDKFGAMMLADDYSMEVPTSRTGEIKFKFDNYGMLTEAQYRNWRMEISTLFSGKFFLIYLLDEQRDQDREYRGLVWAQWDNNTRSQVTFKMTCEPFVYITNYSSTSQIKSPPTPAMSYDIADQESIASLVNGTVYDVPVHSGFFTPVMLEIRCLQHYSGYDLGLSKLTISGAARDPRTNTSEDIVLNNLSLNDNYIWYIDGINKTVTMENTSTNKVSNFYSKCDLWRFPMFRPTRASSGNYAYSGLGSKYVGDNTIKLTWTSGVAAALNVIVWYTPQYL